jgi:hypothetical protein
MPFALWHKIPLSATQAIRAATELSAGELVEKRGFQSLLVQKPKTGANYAADFAGGLAEALLVLSSPSIFVPLAILVDHG